MAFMEHISDLRTCVMVQTTPEVVRSSFVYSELHMGMW